MAKIKTLYSWIGRTDIQCYHDRNREHPGPLATAVLNREYGRIRILSNWPSGDEGGYIPWLLQMLGDKGKQSDQIDIELQNISLKSPTDFSSIYEEVSQVLKENREEEDRTFHLSPGTPSMASMWIILSSGEFPAALIESSRESGLKNVKIPFNIKADFVANAYNRLDALDRDKSFDDIICHGGKMREVIDNAARIAGFKVPVLIFGESGTGKELISRGIHHASGRTGRFIAVNCGAIPRELVESEFFGHKAGSFTGAVKDHDGYLKQADKGTLFLDEIGELPLDSQVKLLRALNNRKVRRIGDDRDITVDIRIIAATNRDLQGRIRDKCFREDLFHRLAVGIINLPPLRDRGDDLTVLIGKFVKEINSQFAKESFEAWENRRLSKEAMQVLTTHSWPGNVRELKNTLKRLIIWAKEPLVSEKEARGSLLTVADNALSEEPKSIPPGFDLNKQIDEYKLKWLLIAKEQSHGNISEAARILGLANYQTLDNWYRKFGLKD